MINRIAAAIAVGCVTFVAGAAGFDGKNLTTNDWFDADFTALTAETDVVQGGTLGITRGAGSWTSVPATGTAKIVADADVGGAATFLELDAPGEELVFTPVALLSATGMETVSATVKGGAVEELPEVGGDVQAAFTMYDDGTVAMPVGYTSDGWTNLVYSGAMTDLTNAWFTLCLDFATVGGVRYVRYVVAPNGGSYTVLGDSDGETWFRAASNATTVTSISFSGAGDVRSFGGDSLEEEAEEKADYYWIGGASGNWADGNNWSDTPGGAAAGTVPASTNVVAFTAAATVGLSGNCNVQSVRFDSDVTFTGGGTLVLNAADSGSAASDAGVVSGAGAIILSNATLRAHVGHVAITNDIVIANVSTNHLTCTSGAGYLSLHGALRGGGTAYCDQSSSGTNDGGVRFYGDTSQFSGSMYLIATNQRPTNWLADTKALDNANSTWNIETGAGREGQTFDGGGSNYSAYFPLRVGQATYKFGALNGYIPYAKAGSSWLAGVNLKVGYLNEDCWLSGNWHMVTDSGLEWCAADATMRYAVTNTAFITIDSGTVELNGAGVLRSGAAITFAGTGATLAFASGVDYDVSRFLSGESTSAVAVDVEDNDLTWKTQLTDGNVPCGLVKKGTGTLTLAAAPTYGGATVVKAGTLVVPQGTTIAELACQGGKLTVPLTGAEDETEVLTISALAEGTAVEDVEEAVSVAGATMSVEAVAGGYVVKATRMPQTFTWTGAVDTDWATPGNWTVGGKVAESLPLAVDTALFPASEDEEFTGWTVVLANDVRVTNVVANGDMKLSGGLIHTGNVRGSGTITLNGNAGFHTYDWENANLQITNNLVIAGTGNKFQTQGSNSYMNGGSIDVYGNVTGDGEITTIGKRSRVRFHGDWTEFSGTVNAQDDGVPRHVLRLMAAQASSSNAVWNVWMSNESKSDSAFLGTSSNSYKTDDMYHYYFGALNGRITIYQQYNNTLEIGALNQDCAFSGTMSATQRNHIKKVGLATLTFSGSGLGRLEVAGGVFASGNNSAIPNECITFSGEGGFFDPTTNTVDFAAKLVNSTTAPIGLLITNDVTIGEIPASNTGGLTKKGSGTLTLSAAPLYTGVTTVEEGELVVPDDTVLDVCFAGGTVTGAKYGNVSFAEGYKFTVGTDARILASGTADVSNLVIYIANPSSTAVNYILRASGGVTGVPTLAFPPETSDSLKERWSVSMRFGDTVLAVAPQVGGALILK